MEWTTLHFDLLKSLWRIWPIWISLLVSWTKFRALVWTVFSEDRICSVRDEIHNFQAPGCRPLQMMYGKQWRWVALCSEWGCHLSRIQYWHFGTAVASWYYSKQSLQFTRSKNAKQTMNMTIIDLLLRPWSGKTRAKTLFHQNQGCTVPFLCIKSRSSGVQPEEFGLI